MENNEVTLEQMQILVDAKAAELSKKLGLKVIPMLFKLNEEFIVGYLKQPTRSTVRIAVDKMEKFGRIEAGDLLLQTSLIQEESDRRIIDESPLYDGINMGACLEALNLIEVNLSVTKKNMINTK